MLLTGLAPQQDSAEPGSWPALGHPLAPEPQFLCSANRREGLGGDGDQQPGQLQCVLHMEGPLALGL